MPLEQPGRPAWVGHPAAVIMFVLRFVFRRDPHPDPWGRKLTALAADPLIEVLPSGARVLAVARKKAAWDHSVLESWFGAGGRYRHGPAVRVTFETARSEAELCAFFQARAADTGWTDWSAPPSFMAQVTVGDCMVYASLHRCYSDDPAPGIQTPGIHTWQLSLSASPGPVQDADEPPEPGPDYRHPDLTGPGRSPDRSRRPPPGPGRSRRRR